MLRLLAFDYPEDAVACSLKDEYMFGPSLLICPVTERCIMTGAGNYREKKRAEFIFRPAMAGTITIQEEDIREDSENHRVRQNK